MPQGIKKMRIFGGGVGEKITFVCIYGLNKCEAMTEASVYGFGFSLFILCVLGGHC